MASCVCLFVAVMRFLIGWNTIRNRFRFLFQYLLKVLFQIKSGMIVMTITCRYFVCARPGSIQFIWIQIMFWKHKFTWMEDCFTTLYNLKPRYNNSSYPIHPHTKKSGCNVNCGYCIKLFLVKIVVSLPLCSCFLIHYSVNRGD